MPGFPDKGIVSRAGGTEGPGPITEAPSPCPEHSAFCFLNEVPTWKSCPHATLYSRIHTGLLCVTVLASASGLGSSEASPEEPLYDVIGELPVVSLYEEIGEAEGKPQGEEDQGVARCNGRCVCSSEGEPGGGALEDQQEGAADHRVLG